MPQDSQISKLVIVLKANMQMWMLLQVEIQFAHQIEGRISNMK